MPHESASLIKLMCLKISAAAEDEPKPAAGFN